MFKQPLEFLSDVKAIKEDHSCTWIEAIIIWCEQNEVEDPEDIAPLVQGTLLEMVQIEAIQAKLITGTNPPQLPL